VWARKKVRCVRHLDISLPSPFFVWYAFFCRHTLLVSFPYSKPSCVPTMSTSRRDSHVIFAFSSLQLALLMPVPATSLCLPTFQQVLEVVASCLRRCDSHFAFRCLSLLNAFLSFFFFVLFFLIPLSFYRVDSRSGIRRFLLIPPEDSRDLFAGILLFAFSASLWNPAAESAVFLALPINLKGVFGVNSVFRSFFFYSTHPAVDQSEKNIILFFEGCGKTVLPSFQPILFLSLRSDMLSMLVQCMSKQIGYSASWTFFRSSARAYTRSTFKFGFLPKYRLLESLPQM